MGKFHFSMQSLLRLREAAERQGKAELAALIEQADKLEQYRDGLAAMLAEETARFEQRRIGGITANDYQFTCDYLESLRVSLEAAGLKVAEARARQAEKQAELQEVYKEKKTLERLREEQYKEFIKQEDVKSAKAMEDILLPSLAGRA